MVVSWCVCFNYYNINIILFSEIKKFLIQNLLTIWHSLLTICSKHIYKLNTHQLMNLGLKAVNARLVICIIALLMPFILVVTTQQRLDSFSQYFYTPAGPFFVGVLSLTAYMMFSNIKWIPAAIALIKFIIRSNNLMVSIDSSN